MAFSFFFLLPGPIPHLSGFGFLFCTVVASAVVVVFVIVAVVVAFVVSVVAVFVVAVVVF